MNTSVTLTNRTVVLKIQHNTSATHCPRFSLQPIKRSFANLCQSASHAPFSHSWPGATNRSKVTRHCLHAAIVRRNLRATTSSDVPIHGDPIPW